MNFSFGANAATAPAAGTTATPAASTAPTASTTTTPGVGTTVAAPSTAIVPVGPPSVLSSAYEDYSQLLAVVQDGWTRSVSVDQLRRVIMQYSQTMAHVQEEVSEERDSANFESAHRI